MMKRWTRGHVSNARKGYKFLLSHAIRKYGDNSWEHVLLEQHEFKTDAKSAEQFFIAYLNTTTPNGYNMTKGGDGVELTHEERQRQRERTKEAMWRSDVRAHHLAAQGNPETKRRHGLASKKMWENPTHRAKHRAGCDASTKFKRHPVHQLDKNTLEIIRTFKSVSEACRETGVHKSSLLNHLRGNQRHSGGFVWRYVT